MIGRSLVRIPAPLGPGILNPTIAPDVQLAPCVAASAVSKGPASDMSRVYPAFSQRDNWDWLQ